MKNCLADLRLFSVDRRIRGTDNENSVGAMMLVTIPTAPFITYQGNTKQQQQQPHNTYELRGAKHTLDFQEGFMCENFRYQSGFARGLVNVGYDTSRFYVSAKLLRLF
jgi:hypothetical protein